MSNNKKKREEALKKVREGKIKDHGYHENLVSGGGMMQAPKIKANEVETGSSGLNVSPENEVIGRRSDWNPDRKG